MVLWCKGILVKTEELSEKDLRRRINTALSLLEMEEKQRFSKIPQTPVLRDATSEAHEIPLAGTIRISLP